MKKSKYSMTTRYLLLFGCLLLAANIILGLVMMNQSSTMIRSLVQENMLNISKTAAGLVDGDQLGSLTEDDVGSAAYNEILGQLSVFQENVDIEYIFAVKRDGADHYVFLVDADPVDPADFGEEVLVTRALRMAALGVPTVDDEPAEDEWGNYYSSYSPVYDSSGAIAGIVGVDFSSEWFDAQIKEHMISITVISLLSILAAAIVIVLTGSKVRDRFNELDSELSLLSDEVEELTSEIRSNPAYKDYAAPILPEIQTVTEAGNGTDEIEQLAKKIGSMQNELRSYLDFMHAQVNTDALTGVGNTTAYTELHAQLEEDIRSGSAAFCVAVFDINDLKLVNDLCGHLCGNQIIQAAAQTIASACGREQTFRIGGDEFAAVVMDCTMTQMEEKLARIDEEIAEFNRSEGTEDMRLSLSAGAASFTPDTDQCFRDTFHRADESMYEKKRRYHAVSRRAGA